MREFPIENCGFCYFSRNPNPNSNPKRKACDPGMAPQYSRNRNLDVAYVVVIYHSYPGRVSAGVSYMILPFLLIEDRRRYVIQAAKTGCFPLKQLAVRT